MYQTIVTMLASKCLNHYIKRKLKTNFIDYILAGLPKSNDELYNNY